MHGEAMNMEEEDIRCIRPSKVSLQNAQINYLHLSPCEEKKKVLFCFSLAGFAFESSQ